MRDYGLAGRSRTPEALPLEARFSTSTIPTLVLLPIQQLYDWIVRPCYNEVFAVLVDEFVLARFRAHAHGDDLPGLRIGFVSSTPIPLEAESPRGFRYSGYLRDWFLRKYTLAGLLPNEAIERGVLGRFAGPASSECKKLLKATRAAAPRIVEALRSNLGVPSMAAVSLIHYLSDALCEGGEWTDLLIHTTYFKNDKILRRIASVIDPACSEPGSDATIVPGQSLHVDNAFTWPPTGFGWWSIRGLIRGFLLVCPVIALYLVGLLNLYPRSREAQLRWASSESVGLATMIRDAENGKRPGVSCGKLYSATPPSVRWYAGITALDLDPTFSIMTSADEVAGRNGYWNAGIEAGAAAMLAAIGKSEIALRLIDRASDRINRERGNPQHDPPTAAWVEERIAFAKHTAAQQVAAKIHPHQNVIEFRSSDVDAAVGRLCEALCPFLEANGSVDGVDFARNRIAALQVVAALKEVAVICTRYGSLKADAKQSILGAISDAVRTVRGSKTVSRGMLDVLRLLLSIDQSLQQQGFFDDADQVISGARTILESLFKIDDITASTVVENSVLLAKAHRWPAKRLHLAEAILRDAERFVRSDPRSLLQERVERCAQIACGYARLGRFHKARAFRRFLRRMQNESCDRDAPQRIRMAAHSRLWTPHRASGGVYPVVKGFRRARLSARSGEHSADHGPIRRPYVLLLGGTKSPAFLGVALDGLERTLPRVERVIFPDLVHNGPEDDGKPDLVAQHLHPFFG